VRDGEGKLGREKVGLKSQTSFAVSEWSQKKKRTKRVKFLDLMEGLVPWQR